MLRYNQKTVISKIFLISLGIFCLIFASSAFMAEGAYALDLNESTDEIGSEIDIEDALENSHDTEVMEGDSQDSEVLAATHTVSGSSFADIRTAVENANSGDTIKLKGTYSSDGNNIVIDKKLIIEGSRDTVMNAKHLSNCFFIKDTAPGTTITGIKFINGKATWGSAIRVNATGVQIEKCSFESNHCDKGGAVYTEYDLYATKNFIIRNCNFTKNTAYKENLEGSSNSAALSAYGINSKVINCIFDSNVVKADADSYGGAIQVGLDLPESNVKVTGCTFINNKVIVQNGNSHGGAGCVREGTEYSNCIFIGNSADRGGALGVHSSGKITNCKFYNNTAKTRYGGAIATGVSYDEMELTIQNCHFEGNEAPEGGAVYVRGQNVKIINSKFQANEVTKYGGAIDVDAENVVIKNSKFYSNIAQINGGAIYVKSNDVHVENSTFISNKAIPDANKPKDGLGGAIYISSALAKIKNNTFKYNRARNGSAIYYSSLGEKLTLTNNVLYQNQAWVYKLPLKVRNIYYGGVEKINATLYGGNNIADYDNLAVSNAIYNAAASNRIVLDGEYPVSGATMSGELYQDSREYNIPVLLTVTHEDGTVVYNDSLNTSYLGEITVYLENLKPGKYSVLAQHFEDTYYKAISNTGSFRVIPRVDAQISKSANSSSFNFDDVVVWTLNITNNGPNNATGVVVYDRLPEGLVWLNDDSKGRYDHETGLLNISDLKVGENIVFKITTLVNRTGIIVNGANITSIENDTDMSNNYDEHTINVNPACDLAIVKTVNSSNPRYRDHITWTVEVTNNGPDIAHNVTVQEILSKALIYLESDGDYDYPSGVWNVGTLEKGGKARLNIRCIVNGTGTIENAVSVNGSEYDYDLSNNNYSALIHISPASDLAISKSANCSVVNYGDFVKWTLTVINNGPDIASDVKVEDILPEGFIFISSTHNYSDGRFDIDNIDVGQTIKIDIISKVNVTGNHTNFANVSSPLYDVNLTNNQDNESICVKPACDLAVVKLVDESEPNYHDTITWTIEVSNDGPDVAHNVVVSDMLPDSLIWIDDDSNGRYDPITGIWNITELDVGDFMELNIQCLVNGTGMIENFVSVSSDEYDYNLTNNSDNETIDVEESADVSVSKSVNNSAPNYNDLIRWTLVISNRGPDKATDIRVVDLLPSGLVFVDYEATKGIFVNGTWMMCCLNSSEVESLDIICRVNRTGRITNFANITANEYDSNLTDNEDNESVDVPLAVDLKVEIAVNNTNPQFGEIVNWMICVKNNGPDNATSVILHELLPDELIFLDYSSSRGEYDDSWNIGSLEVGESEYLNVTTYVNALDLIANAVIVESFEYDWNMSNNYADAVVDVSPVSDLEITKSVSNPNPNYGDIVKWKLTVSNKGPNQATGVFVYDALPKELKFIRSNGNYHDGVWDVGNLRVGEKKILEIVCRVISTGHINNIADVVSNEFDPDFSNNRDEESIFVRPASDLSVVKTASKYYHSVGDVIEYVIEVTNNGPDDAYNVKVREILDDLLHLMSFSATKGNFNKATNTWSIDCLENGQSARLYLRAIAIRPGIIKNSVTVSSDSFDFDLSNNNDSAIVNVTEKVDVPSKAPDAKNSPVHYPVKSNGGQVIEKHVTANPFAVLVGSLFVSMIFFGTGISKKS